MRRKDRQITDRTEIMQIVRKCNVCNLAFANGDTPYVIPMNFGVTEENGSVALWFHCASEGQKLEMLQKNGRVAFAMSTGHTLEWEESGHCTMRYESVCGVGDMRIVSDEEKTAGLDAIMDHYRPEHAVKSRMQYPDAMLKRTTILKLEVAELTGKRSAPEK